MLPLPRNRTSVLTSMQPLPRNLLHARSQSAAPATQNEGSDTSCRPCHAIVHSCSPNTAPATQSARQVAQRCACHATHCLERTNPATQSSSPSYSAAPATQNGGPKRTKSFWTATNAAPATQCNFNCTSARPVTNKVPAKPNGVGNQASLRSTKCHPCHRACPCHATHCLERPNCRPCHATAPATKSARQVTNCGACQAPKHAQCVTKSCTKRHMLPLPGNRTSVLTKCCHELHAKSHKAAPATQIRNTECRPCHRVTE